MFNLKMAKKIINEQGRTTKWLAEKCLIKHKTMATYLRGLGVPSAAVAKLMAEALGVKFSEIYTYTPKNGQTHNKAA